MWPAHHDGADAGDAADLGKHAAATGELVSVAPDRQHRQLERGELGREVVAGQIAAQRFAHPGEVVEVRIARIVARDRLAEPAHVRVVPRVVDEHVVENEVGAERQRREQQPPA
jgi:hypothetical protein